MPEDEIITLDSGERVRVTPDGEKILIPGPSPMVEEINAQFQEQEQRQQELRQVHLDAIAEKLQEQEADPAVPPEKRIF